MGAPAAVAGPIQAVDLPPPQPRTPGPQPGSQAGCPAPAPPPCRGSPAPRPSGSWMLPGIAASLSLPQFPLGTPGGAEHPSGCLAALDPASARSGGAPPRPGGGRVWAGEHHPELPHGGKSVSGRRPGARPGEWVGAPRCGTSKCRCRGGRGTPPRSPSLPVAGVRGAFPERKPARKGFLYSINIQRGPGGGQGGRTQLLQLAGMSGPSLPPPKKPRICWR